MVDTNKFSEMIMETCKQCNQEFRMEDLINLDDGYLCNNCKAGVFQRIVEGPDSVRGISDKRIRGYIIRIFLLFPLIPLAGVVGFLLCLILKAPNENFDPLIWGWVCMWTAAGLSVFVMVFYVYKIYSEYKLIKNQAEQESSQPLPGS